VANATQDCSALSSPNCETEKLKLCFCLLAN